MLHRGSRDFSERDRELLTVLRPHLAAARRNAELRQLYLAARSHPAERVGVALISPVGPLLSASPLAEKLIARYLDGASRPPYLPADLERWIGSQRARRDAGELWEPGAPLAVDSSAGRLTVRYLPASPPASPDLLLLVEPRPTLEPAALREVGLTRREAEVVAMLARGAADKRIAVELGVSIRTVQKHLERVYRKLGVSSRGAAVATARRDAGA